MKLFNDALTMRFNTLERNIKSKSNSFYDSYLDLLEATIKYILDENGIEYDDSRTCGYIVKDESIKLFLLNKLCLDDFTYNKLLDYIKKCNDHKHKKEKWLGIDSVINYLKIYFDFINSYISSSKGTMQEFNAEYYVSIFGENERLNSEYKNEVLKLKDELKDSLENNKLSQQNVILFKSLLSEKELDEMPMPSFDYLLGDNPIIRKKANGKEQKKTNSSLGDLYQKLFKELKLKG